MPKSKLPNLVEIVRFIPNMETAQVAAMASAQGCEDRTVYRALKIVRVANSTDYTIENLLNMTQRNREKLFKKLKNKQKGKGTHNNAPIPPPMKGGKGQTPKAFKAPAANAAGKIKKITKSMSFELFSKYHSYPDYDGLYRWQIAADKKIGYRKFAQITVSRESGKSIYLAYLTEYRMSQGWDVLYLGWTTRRKEVAQFIHTFFQRRGEAVVDKTASQFHFKTTLNTQFDTFSVKSKEVLGKHAMGVQNRQILPGENDYLQDFVRDSDNPLLLIIDDPIDGTFRKERTKEKDLEDFYDSTIIPINPDQTINVGTKKFEKDFFHYFEHKYKDKLVKIKSGPFLNKKSPRYGKEKDNPCNLLCPELWIWHEDPQYKKYLKLRAKIEMGILIDSFSAPDKELARKRDLWEAKQIMNPYWWFAEYMQDPHPITGEVWKDVVYRNVIKTQSAYNLLVISIDRATTQKKTSDETGIVVMLREYNPNADPSKEKPEPNQYLVINDLTQKITIAELIPLVHQLYNDYMAHYGRTLMIRVIVEKQGGGDDFCDLAYAAGFRWASKAIMIRVHNSRNKEDRTLDLLQMPITNGTVEFLSTLKESKLIDQVLSFPYAINDDAIDALGTGKLEGDKIAQKHSPRALREALETGGKQDQLKQWNNIFGQSKSSSHGEGIF